MKSALKQNLKKIPLYYLYRVHKQYKKMDAINDQLKANERFRAKHTISAKPGKVIQLNKALSLANININPYARFQYWIDAGLFLDSKGFVLGNTTPDLSSVIFNGINTLISNYNNNKVIGNQNIEVLKAVKQYIFRILKKIESEKIRCSSSLEVEKLDRVYSMYSNMLDNASESLEEALQRILFWSSLFWQTGHYHVGLGRLDKLLDSFIVPDDISEIIYDFFNCLHSYYAMKSGMELGDTGQIIVLGGVERDGSYFCNELTYEFIRVLKHNPLPDPKLLLRVSNAMPRDLLKLALECIATGVGCPLLSNDDRIIKDLQHYVYNDEDTYDYVTAACWEPVICGKSLDIGNLTSFNFASPFIELFSNLEPSALGSFNDLLEAYFDELSVSIHGMLEKLDSIEWENDPLFTLFTNSCYESNKDIGEGGAYYNNYGVTTTGLSSAVDSLLFIKHHVFENSDLDFKSLCEMIANGAFEESCIFQMQAERAFGTDDPEAISMSRLIIDEFDSRISNYTNAFGGKIKWGLSSPDYVVNGQTTPMTLDGRLNGAPLSTHISAPTGAAYTALVNFASALDYSGSKSNGNVVDFFVSPSIINNHFDKFMSFIHSAIVVGFFQMQINVVDSKTLINAREYPESFKDLIVRVWGFSAYFVDLSSEYQNALIERSLANERHVL